MNLETEQVLRVLTQSLNLKITSLSDACAQGRVICWEDYKFLTGQIAGLKTAIQYIQDLTKQSEED